ncbi:MAG: PVC-type heme-binding CxxCH protein [Limisphaerales bacterium]
MGGTGDSPVPSGDSPLGRESGGKQTVAVEYRTRLAVSSGRWPDDTGQWPVLPDGCEIYGLTPDAGRPRLWAPRSGELRISDIFRPSGLGLRILAAISVALFSALTFVTAQERDDPAAELASFQVADGFEVNLFASEKDGVTKPIQIRFGARGRLWVIGSTVYPQLLPGQIPNDKVLILEDRDGDGRCDQTTVFADGLMIPTGLELGDGGVYVGQGTELLFLKDTDGDGKADERRVLLRGFGTGDAHQMINSFLFGPGGELWFSQGLHIRSHVETPWGLAHLEQAGLWRLWPRRLKLEGFYGSAHEPQNPWGFVFTDWQEPIVLAGNNSSPIYPVPGLVLNHRDDPPALIWKNGNGRKVSGGDIVGTAHFPDAWQGTLIVGGYINNAVWALKISDDGAGFSLADLPPLITSTDRSFRPVDVKFGPDGALYLCDWYNPIIGHYQASFRHPDRDKTHGRIWRVTAKGRSLTKPPALVDASAAELLDDLKSSDRWTRHFAKRVLADRPTDKVTAALNEWIAGPGLTEHALVEALGVYQSHEVIAPDLLGRLCHATNAAARAYAAGVVGAWADRLPDPLALLRPLVADENPRVRLQAVVACTYVPKPGALEVAAVAADFPTDKFLAYALNQAVFSLKPYWLPAFKAGNLNLENKPSRLGLLVRADGTPDTLQTVRDLLQSQALDAAARETFLRILADTGGPDDLAAILKLTDAPLLVRLLPALTTAARVRNVRPAGDLAALMRPLIESTNRDLRAEALKLAGVWKLETFHSTVDAIALDAHAKEQSRRAAIQALASFGDDASRKTLSRLADEGAPSVQSAVITALCRLDLVAAARYAAGSFSRLRDETELSEVFSAFLQRQGGAAALADALTAKPPPKQAAEAGLRVMSAGGRRNGQLARLLTEAAGLNRTGNHLAPDEIAAFAAEVRASGDARAGAEIFRRASLGCAVCHTVDGRGGNIGPNLSALGTAQPVDFIIGAILDPQKEVKEGYLSISVTTKDGEEYQGYQVRETRDELVLRDVLQNKEIRLRRDTITERKENGSVMPAGLADTLTRAEFRDLVRFLSGLGKPN